MSFKKIPLRNPNYTVYEECEFNKKDKTIDFKKTFIPL